MPGRSGSFSPADSNTSDRGSIDNGLEKSRKPDNTAFKQQRLPAWQPILTAQSVLPGFFIIALIFIPVGVSLLLASNEIIEVSVDYTHCDSIEGLEKCADIRSNMSRMAEKCSCSVTLDVNKNMSNQVYIYYGLTNLFQNHRRYVRSRDDAQLNGDKNSISSDCSPYRYFNETLIPIAPCGAIANSLFNDTFTIVNGPEGNQGIPINLTGIAWPTDKDQKFNNPLPTNNITEAFSNFAKPDYWQKPVYELDIGNPNNNGYKNEGFIVWMRTAAFPTFRKPYGRIETGLPAGQYNITIEYNYPVVAFQGTKRFIVSTTSWIGGKNSFLGIAYIVVGSLCFAIGIALCIVHQVTKKTSSTAPR